MQCSKNTASVTSLVIISTTTTTTAAATTTTTTASSVLLVLRVLRLVLVCISNTTAAPSVWRPQKEGKPGDHVNAVYVLMQL